VHFEYQQDVRFFSLVKTCVKPVIPDLLTFKKDFDFVTVTERWLLRSNDKAWIDTSKDCQRLFDKTLTHTNTTNTPKKPLRLRQVDVILKNGVMVSSC
jgi:hypothetical protein